MSEFKFTDKERFEIQTALYEFGEDPNSSYGKFLDRIETILSEREHVASDQTDMVGAGFHTFSRDEVSKAAKKIESHRFSTDMVGAEAVLEQYEVQEWEVSAYGRPYWVASDDAITAMHRFAANEVEKWRLAYYLLKTDFGQIESELSAAQSIIADLEKELNFKRLA